MGQFKGVPPRARLPGLPRTLAACKTLANAHTARRALLAYRQPPHSVLRAEVMSTTQNCPKCGNQATFTRKKTKDAKQPYFNTCDKCGGRGEFAQASNPPKPSAPKPKAAKRKGPPTNPPEAATKKQQPSAPSAPPLPKAPDATRASSKEKLEYLMGLPEHAAKEGVGATKVGRVWEVVVVNLVKFMVRAKDGHPVEETKQTRDGGRDAQIVSNHNGVLARVEVKWSKNKIGRDTVATHWGQCKIAQPGCLIVISNNGFTPNAETFAKENSTDGALTGGHTLFLWDKADLEETLKRTCKEVARHQHDLSCAVTETEESLVGKKLFTAAK